ATTLPGVFGSHRRFRVTWRLLAILAIAGELLPAAGSSARRQRAMDGTAQAVEFAEDHARDAVCRCVPRASAGADVSRGAEGAQATPDPAARARALETYGKLPLSFEKNEGQTDGRVRYFTRGRGYGFFLTPTEVVFSLRGSAPTARRDTLGTRAEGVL